MKIVIKENASDIYLKRERFPNMLWAETLSKIEGQTIEVETFYLFDNQYNTGPISGVTEQGLRIMDESVEKVIDDERIGKVKCSWCGTSQPETDKCINCGKTEYIKQFKIARRFRECS